MNVKRTLRLANRFVVSDHTLSMADSPSRGGHLYAAKPSTGGFLGNIHQPKKGSGPPPGGVQLERRHGLEGALLAHPASAELRADSALGIANGGAFESTPVRWKPTIFDRLDAAGLSWHLYNGAPSNGWAICPSLADCWYTPQRNHEATVAAFPATAAAGKLPAYSLVIPGATDAK